MVEFYILPGMHGEKQTKKSANSARPATIFYSEIYGPVIDTRFGTVCTF